MPKALLPAETTTDSMTVVKLQASSALCLYLPHDSVPFLALLVSHDDPRLFDVKGKFIAENISLGFSMWSISGDYNDLLVDAITKDAGVKDDDSVALRVEDIFSANAPDGISLY
jgi:GH18 family chitinase